MPAATEEGQEDIAGQTCVNSIHLPPDPALAPPLKLTFLHHADVHTALEPAGLAVAAVVLGDAAVSIEGTGEQCLPLHAPSAETAQTLVWVTYFPAPWPCLWESGLRGL